MRPRTRVRAYGSAAVVAIAGFVCSVVSGNLAVQAIGYTALGLGLGAIVLLVFYEIGLSEDREREAEEKRRRGER